MKTLEWHWKSSDGLDFYSQGWVPDGKVKAVVGLIHGLGEHIGRYTHVGAALAEAGYALLGFDLRGHGRSGGPRGHTPTFEAYLDDLDLFLKQMEERFPDKPKFLYGHSLGGILVLTYPPLRHSKLVGVIAVAPPFRSALEQQKVKVAMAKVLGSLLPTIVITNGVDPKTLSHDPAVVSAYVNDPLVHNRVTTGWGKIMLDMIAVAYKNAPEFPLPALIMHGQKDVLGFPISSQEFADLMPKGLATLKIWDGLYHEIHNEPEKEQVFKVMTDWLDAQLHAI
jgi:alpha-beta hydrolase superfamily lysophospholipase